MGQMAEDLQERPLGVLPSNTITDLLAELTVVTSMDGLTLDESFIPHSNFLVYQDKEQEPETKTEVVEIPSDQSKPLALPAETRPLFTPKPKENLDPNPYEPLIPYPSWLKEENFQALDNPTGCTDHFVYRIDIVDSLCDKFPIENNFISGNLTPSSDSVVESLSPLPTTFGDNDSLVEEIDTLLVTTVVRADFVILCVLYVFGVGYVILYNQSIERDRLNGIEFVLNFVKFISFTFGDKEMIFGDRSGFALIVLFVDLELAIRSEGCVSDIWIGGNVPTQLFVMRYAPWLCEQLELLLLDRGTRSVPNCVFNCIFVHLCFNDHSELNGAKIEQSG
ncbi:hypothetical protein Tco_0575199 [Tanacetum coccineum]